MTTGLWVLNGSPAERTNHCRLADRWPTVFLASSALRRFNHVLYPHDRCSAASPPPRRLTNNAASAITQRKISTETAEPRPRFRRVTSA